MIIYAIVDPTGLRDPAGYDVASGGGGDAGVTDLFLAGMGPALLIGVVLAFYSYHIGLKMKGKEAATPVAYLKFFVGAGLLLVFSPLVALAFIGALAFGMYLHTFGSKEDLAARAERGGFNVVELWVAFRDGFWAIFLPVLILGGIYSGLFTPTEAAAVSVIYAALVEFFIHRSLTLEDIPKIFTESVILMGSLFVIIALALGFNMYLDRAKIPEAAVEMILSLDLSIFTFLLIVNVLLLIVGFFMDILSAILILVPLLAPIAFGLGIHPAAPGGRVHREPRDRVPDAADRAEPVRGEHAVQEGDRRGRALRAAVRGHDARVPDARDLRADAVAGRGGAAQGQEPDHHVPRQEGQEGRGEEGGQAEGCARREEGGRAQEARGRQDPRGAHDGGR
jgi:hypothetical protein